MYSVCKKWFKVVNRLRKNVRKPQTAVGWFFFYSHCILHRSLSMLCCCWCSGLCLDIILRSTDTTDQCQGVRARTSPSPRRKNLLNDSVAIASSTRLNTRLSRPNILGLGVYSYDFSDLNEILYALRCWWVMYNSIPYDQGQGHRGLKCAKMADFKGYFLHW